MTVILTAQGVTRVLDGQKGMTFIVDRVSLDRDKRATVMHVRDYRFPRHGAPGLSYQIWTLGEGDYIEAATL